MLAPPVIGLVAPGESPLTRSLGLLLRAAGADVRIVTSLAAASQISKDDVCGWVVIAASLGAADQPSAAALLASLSSKPVLIYGLGEGSEVLDAVHGVYGFRLKTSGLIKTNDYSFMRSEPILWPFAGTRLSEAEDRTAATVNSDAPGFQPLVSTEGGPVFARFARDSRELFISTVDSWPGGPPALIRHAFWASSFLNTLPVLVFARHVLRDRGWARPRCQATAIVDDPNLRRLDYGHLRFGEAIQQARAHDFHITIGFIPLDYRRSSPAAVRLFVENPGQLSLVVHGNDHRKRELARPASPAQATFGVRQALARMDRHRQLTSLACPPVMTLPHGDCTRVWVRALRDAGYAAAIAGRTDAFLDPPGEGDATPLHEMVPAEMGIFGFPILSRLSLARPLDELLFAAWLGKPLIVYTHHEFFSKGWDNFLQATDFINRQIGPEWVGIGTMVAANYLIRRVGTTAEVRAFSNDLAIDIPSGVDEVVCLKEGREIPWESEVVMVDGAVVGEVERCSERLRVTVSALGRSNPIHVRFAPALTQEPFVGWERTNVVSAMRRMVTETRDRLDPRLQMMPPAVPS